MLSRSSVSVPFTLWFLFALCCHGCTNKGHFSRHYATLTLATALILMNSFLICMHLTCFRILTLSRSRALPPLELRFHRASRRDLPRRGCLDLQLPLQQLCGTLICIPLAGIQSYSHMEQPRTLENVICTLGSHMI